MSIPDYVSKRISIPATLKYIVEKSTPVVCFGDITKAKVITIGINPSSSEFTKIANQERRLLTHSERRLSDLEFLAASSTESLKADQIEKQFLAAVELKASNLLLKIRDLLK